MIDAEREVSADGKSVCYRVKGPLFFGSSNDLFEHFQYAEDPQQVTVDLTHAQIWDASSVAALDAIENRYLRYNTRVSIIGLDAHSTHMHQRLSGHL
ncbi:hypothetical protein AU504_13815 [Lonsdalea populi]|nr:hypothetical protein AU508_08445 [Lonsdalea populi]RAT67701.1 hypothetical protein AU504_13815 [Lonsdalea populi]RAT74936.1 hypothetical protein AU505_00290 [Lonsdalea populi]RAT76887.1 hypothetical protein AU507_13120 [Lonsdalea populi]RAT78081.1 hypothetical protein AU506_00255 [Lonsdalea populi]